MEPAGDSCDQIWKETSEMESMKEGGKKPWQPGDRKKRDVVRETDKERKLLKE